MITIAEYVWIDAFGNTRSKAKTITEPVLSISDLPYWNFDGSSTGQAPANDSEVILKPVAIFADPIRAKAFKNENIRTIFVLCECVDKECNPISSNMRAIATSIFEKVTDQKTWFGLEQEYVLYSNNKTILGWPDQGFPEAQGKYYCGAGADRTFGRAIAEEHYLTCLEAGLLVSGINEEVLPGQWEYQIGPCEGISAGDQLWLSRYLLHRICEKHGVTASFDPKPVLDWNGSGLHTNYSTESMRNKDGINHIYHAIERLSHKHTEHIVNYGDNSKRLTGHHETSNINTFTYGIGDRTASIRIPTSVYKDGKGYLEDRRPAANADPYIVTSLITATTLL